MASRGKGFGTERARLVGDGLGTERARLALGSKIPPETDTFGKFFKNHVKVVFLMVPNLTKILKSGFKPLKVHTFGKFFQKSCENGDFDFCWSAPQFVQNIKPIRQLLCTFSSGSDLGIYIIYNIYI